MHFDFKRNLCFGGVQKHLDTVLYIVILKVTPPPPSSPPNPPICINLCKVFEVGVERVGRKENEKMWMGMYTWSRQALSVGGAPPVKCKMSVLL